MEADYNTTSEKFECYTMNTDGRSVMIQEHSSCIVVLVKTGKNTPREIIKMWKFNNGRIYFNNGMINAASSTHVTPAEFTFIFDSLKKIYAKMNRKPVKLFHVGDIELPPYFVDSDFSQRFLDLVHEKLKNVDDGARLDYVIPHLLSMYEDTPHKELLIDIAATAIKTAIKSENFVPVGWSKMSEFENYPFKQRCGLCLGVWNNTGNPLFLFELASLAYKNYNQ